MKRKIFLLTTMLSLVTSLIPSGGFGGGGISQIPEGKDKDKYHLGKSIYNKEEIKLGDIDKTKEAQQLDRLEYLQGSLPNTEKRRVNLLELAGKLSKEQLDSLEYFISVRFNLKLKSN
jgi:hypothetical protein